MNGKPNRRNKAAFSNFSHLLFAAQDAAPTTEYTKLKICFRIYIYLGFTQPLHSTLTALLEATNTWSVNIDNGFLNGVVFIDPKKAFDKIAHEIILR